MNLSPNAPQSLGFTVREMLVSIGAMFLIIALLVPTIWLSQTSHAETQRTARLLSAVSYQAQRAGVDFVAGADVHSAVQSLLVGGKSADGRVFQVPGLSAADAMKAGAYLQVESGRLIYRPR